MYIKKKVRCPKHYLLKPGCYPFVMIPDPALKNISDEDLKRFKLSRFKPKRDRFGQKIQDWNSYYQPEMSAAFIIEHAYDPLSPICKQCAGRCKEGAGIVNERAIKRLNG